MASTAYREGLSRDARALWLTQNLPAPLLPPRPSARRCQACGYREDAPGHQVTCGGEG